MFLTNHTLTGVVLARVIDDPILVAPAALASHFALDGLPHFGLRGRWPFGSKPWLAMAAVDNVLALGIFVAALATRPDRWVQTVAGVFFACLPDLMFIVELLRKKRFQGNWRRFHSRIQWSESPPGAITEIIWAGLMVLALTRLVQ